MLRIPPAWACACALLLLVPAVRAMDAASLSVPSRLKESGVKWQLHAPSIALSMVDEQGRPLPIHFRHGWNVAVGQPLQKYAVNIANTTSARVRVVLSVDKLDPRSGRRAYRGQPGYVLDPGQSIRISSMHSKNRDDVPLAFPAHMPLIKSLDDLGRIDVAVFRERMDYPIQMPWSFSGTQIRKGMSEASKANRWVPPSGAPFRPLSAEPETVLFLGYAIEPSLVVAP